MQTSNQYDDDDNDSDEEDGGGWLTRSTFGVTTQPTLARTSSTSAFDVSIFHFTAVCSSSNIFRTGYFWRNDQRGLTTRLRRSLRR
jgi:hypothetical protein